MAIVGFNFSKIHVDRNKAIPPKVEIKSKIKITDIQKENFKISEGKDVLKFDFLYEIEYAPNLAKLSFNGHLLVVEDPKKTEDILKDWKKLKDVDAKTKLRVYNTIFHKCNIKAFQLEEDFNLPLHLKLPSIKVN